MKTHGLSKTKIYSVWKDIKNRCLRPNRRGYENYGGRGIEICERWLDFQNFYEDVSKLEHFGEPGYTLDRIDNDGNYEPGNVRWVKTCMQNRNKRSNVLVDYYGVPMLLVDVARITGISYPTLNTRYHKGDRGEKLIRPVKKVAPKSDLILIDNNQALTTSLIVAEKFGKRHDNILQAIENELNNLREIANENPNDLNFKAIKIDAAFIKGKYKDSRGRLQPMCYLNRDAFSLIVMGFTGKVATEWKWKYIQEFNRMEAALKSSS